MTPREKESIDLILKSLCIIFLFLFIYMIFNILTNRNMNCGCEYGCIGKNISCPCYRKKANNEYFKPEIGNDFTSYLNKVRENQLKKKL